MTARAAMIVTGTEVLTGRVADRNGPWVAEQLRLLGVDIGQIVVVGDRPDDLRSALRAMLDAEIDLVITSGGLGPTADDLTTEIVAEVQGRELQLDTALEARIAGIVERLSRGRGWRTDPEATAAGVRKQALVPAGAGVLEPVGTAPGLVVPPADGRPDAPVVVLPGPPSELQGMWPTAVAHPLVVTALAGRHEIRQRTVRLRSLPESELAAALRDLAPGLDGFDRLEITTCLRSGELEIVTRYGPEAQAAYDALAQALTSRFADHLISADGRTVDRVLADALLARGLTVATAESCTAGLLAGRLTDLPGSSAYVLGGLVTYSNAAKHDLAGVDAALIERVGAVSPEVARAMAEGARRALHADVGVGITGIAGPDGGSPDKPVGLVELCAVLGDDVLPRTIHVPGSRADVRGRTVVAALHLMLDLLAQAAQAAQSAQPATATSTRVD